MSPSLVQVIVFSTVLSGLAVVGAYQSKLQRQIIERLLGHLATKLRGQVDLRRRRVTGTYRGRTASFRLDLVGSGADAERRSVVDVALDAEPFFLEVRRREHGMRERDERVDLSAVAPGFDASFVVVGAPREVVLAGLDASVREQLSGLPSARLETPRPGVLRLWVRGWSVDLWNVNQLLNAAVDASASFARARQHVDRAALAALGSPYRAECESSLRERHERERAEVERLRASRPVRLPGVLRRIIDRWRDG